MKPLLVTGSEGILFVATGDPYARQAAIAATSIRRSGNRQPIALVTDSATGVPAVFDSVVREGRELSEDFFRSRISALARSPFERTLFLDADTYVTRPLGPLFGLLDRFDLAAAHAPNRVTLALPGVPDAYPEFNCGVLLYRRSALSPGFFDAWLAAYDELAPARPASFDQPSFRSACFQTTLRIATLPPEWNCRFTMGGYANIPAGILHGWASAAEYERLATCLAAATGRDTFSIFGDRVLFQKPETGPLREVARMGAGPARGRLHRVRAAVALRTRIRRTRARVRGAGRGVFVVGMHRSGTSAAARVVNLLGVPVGDPADLIEPDARSNPKGHWESSALAAFNDRLLELLGGTWSTPPPMTPGWETQPDIAALRAEAVEAFDRVYSARRWLWKDPRLCLTLPFWRSALRARAAAILVFRHPVEVARSLAVRDGFDIARSLTLWEEYNRGALAAVVGLPVLVSGYDELLGDPAGWGQAASAFLAGAGIKVGAPPAGAIEEFVDHRLRHSALGTDALENEFATESQCRLYSRLLSLRGIHRSFAG